MLFNRKNRALKLDAVLNEINKMDFPERVKLLARLAAKNDKFCAVFGAENYRYKFNPPATPDAIADFEKSFNIELPKSFYRYLTEVGNGGAGVDYGIYSLKDIAAFNEHLHFPGGEKVIFEYDDIHAEWCKMLKELDDIGDDGVLFDKIVGKMFRGLLVICTPGCSGDYVLVCEGKYKGMVGVINWDLIQEFEPKLSGMDFETWICDYFQKIIRGEVKKHRRNRWTVNGNLISQ